VSDQSSIAGLAPAVLDQLADALAERIARRLPELLAAQHDEWVDVGEIARRFSLSEATIYAHADELGARRLGDGPKARLRFSPDIVARALTSRSDRNGSADPVPPAVAAPTTPSRRRRQAPRAQRVPLLPPRGHRE
jgi:hypothetical protein